jgi:hypothetical protein
MSFSRFAVPASLALLAAGAASAQTMGTQVQPGSVDAPSTFAQLDANRDGSISPGEAAANTALSNSFVSLDANGDGALEPAEFSRFEVIGAGTTRGTPGSPGTPGSVTPPLGSTPPPMNRTPPPMGSTPPPSGSTPPPTGSTPPPQQ